MEPDIAFVDIETTGLGVDDKILQVGAIKVNRQTRTQEEKVWMINPQREITPGAYEMHKITSEMVKDCPPFAALAAEIYGFLQNCYLLGYNIVKFDNHVLDREFKAAGFPDFMKDRKTIDVLNIFKKNESHSLERAVRFYLDREHIKAHDALEDCRVTRDVFLAQVVKYKLPADMNLIYDYARNVNPNMVDADGKLEWNPSGEATFTFGKYKGLSLQSVIARDPGYFDWVLASDFPPYTKTILQKARAGEFPKRK